MEEDCEEGLDYVFRIIIGLDGEFDMSVRWSWMVIVLSCRLFLDKLVVWIGVFWVRWCVLWVKVGVECMMVLNLYRFLIIVDFIVVDIRYWSILYGI